MDGINEELEILFDPRSGAVFGRRKRKGIRGKRVPKLLDQRCMLWRNIEQCLDMRDQVVLLIGIRLAYWWCGAAWCWQQTAQAKVLEPCHVVLT